jgi:hypothetical protein
MIQQQSYTVKILRTPCCTQVTKTKDSYLYQQSCSAETRWHAVDWVTAREHNVLATDCGWNDLFSDYNDTYVLWLYNISILSTSSCHSTDLIFDVVTSYLSLDSSTYLLTRAATQYLFKVCIYASNWIKNILTNFLSPGQTTGNLRLRG